MIRDILRDEIKKAVKNLFGKEVDFSIGSGGVHADYSSNIAMILGSPLTAFGASNPRENAEKIKQEMSQSKNFNKYFPRLRLLVRDF